MPLFGGSTLSIFSGSASNRGSLFNSASAAHAENQRPSSSLFNSAPAAQAENQRPSSPTPRNMKVRAAPKKGWTPNCTHITMDRVHYGQKCPCPVCGRVPAMGFLYECRQDLDGALSHYNTAADDDDSGVTSKSDLRLELERIGLSESIIKTAEQGGYTDEQLWKLKLLKCAVKDSLTDASKEQQPNNVMSRIFSYGQGLSNNDGAFGSVPTRTVSTPICSFLACHTCRPYYKDRVYLNFEAVLSNEIKPLSYLDAAALPTKSAQIMREIGLEKRSPAPAPDDVSPTTYHTATDSTGEDDNTSSVLTFQTTQSDVDDLDESRRHRRRFYKMGHRSSGSIARDIYRAPYYVRTGLKAAFQNFFRPSRESSSSGSNITLPLPRTSVARRSTDEPAVGEFDMGALRRVRRQKERVNLRFHAYSYGREADSESSPTDRRHSQLDTEDGISSSGYSVYSGASEGSEVEVQGGLALTEEAVETHTPDILDTSIFEMEIDSDDAEAGVDSIMTQV